MPTPFLRVKRHFQILPGQGNYYFIKTLDEGTTLPEQPFVDTFLEQLSKNESETALVEAVMRLEQVSEAAVRKFIGQMIDAGVLEYFAPGDHPFGRYDRQLLFWDVLEPTPTFEDNFDRQEKLARAHVAVIGIGGIGHYIALSLAASGLGTISLVDDDIVEESNLSRQILFSNADVGRPKVEAASQRLLLANPACRIMVYGESIDSAAAFESLLSRITPVDYLVLSADKAIGLVQWASDRRKQYDFKLIKCGYMGYQGLIGPILGPETRGYEELYQSWAERIDRQPPLVKALNERHHAPASSASNAILANIACLEMLKDLTGAGQVNLMEKRLLFNLNTLEMRYG